MRFRLFSKIINKLSILFYNFIKLIITTRKTIFSFSGRPEKMVFPTKLRWNMIFLVLLGKMIFSSPENMILHLRRNMKDDLSWKIHGNMIFSSDLLKRWSFQKGLCRHMIFLVLSGKMVFVSQKPYFFYWAESKRRPLPGNTWKHDASPSEEKQETWYIVLKLGFSLNLSGWRYSLQHSAHRSCVWGCAWAPIREIICPLVDRL